MCSYERKLCQREKKLTSPSQQEIIETEEDIFAKYNNSYYEYYCNYLFPQAIEYGMSSEEFWKDDPQLFVSYRTSFLNKKEREVEENDYKSWLMGLYIHDGNGKLFMSLKQFLHNMVAGMFKGKKDNTQVNTYPEKPYGELAKEKQKELKKENQNKKYEEYQKSFAYYGTLKQRYLENLKRKENR